jgi:hypothetical protein
MKKQTLEEFINSQPYYGHGTPEYLEGIEVGAKWQQEQAKEMEKDKQSEFTIDFINWLHLNEYKYNPKAKLYQKQFINETLFFSIDELFITFNQQEQ